MESCDLESVTQKKIMITQPCINIYLLVYFLFHNSLTRKEGYVDKVIKQLCQPFPQGFSDLPYMCTPFLHFMVFEISVGSVPSPTNMVVVPTMWQKF